MQARYMAEQRPEIRQADVQALLAWRQGQVVLDGQSLGEVLPLIGRYLQRDVRVADAQAAAMRPGGIYDVASLEGLLYQLPKILPVDVTTQADGSVLVASRYKAL
jgi:transmembrane sensor